MDILEKVIEDVNKMHEVAMKAAEKSLHQKYSKDLKKMYLNELNGGMSADNFNIDEDMLEEFDLNELDQGKDGKDPSGVPEQNPLSAGGAPGPDSQLPLDSGNDSQEGLPPQQPVSPVVDKIPGSWEDVDDGITITFDNMDSPDAGNFDSLAANAQGEAEKFLANQDTLDTGMEQDPLQTQEEDGPESLNHPNPFSDNPFESKSVFEVSDQMLFEYIEKSIKNDSKIEELETIINELQVSVESLAKQLDSQNKTVESLKEQNIRLMYKNQALNDDSLSEHQKKNIIKSLDNAKSINEAKAVYQTIKDSLKTVGSENKKTILENLITPNAGKKFIAEKKTPVIKESKESDVPAMAEKLFKHWGI